MLMSMSRVFALSFHADYRCQHSGVCCSSDWDVPVELPIYRTLTEALANGRIAPENVADRDLPPLIVEDDLPDDAAAMLARTPRGECVFYHRDSRLCAIHRDAGETHLPATCRHFPRLAVRDGRGTTISLTHYCPTAARSLFRTDVPIEIVEAPVAFPPADYEGLSIGPEDWPPLLHPTLLMDLEGYDGWERHMVARCADPLASAESVVRTLERDARAMHLFTPGSGTLTDAIARLAPEFAGIRPEVSLGPSLVLHAEVLAAVPPDLKPDPDEDGLAEAFTTFVAPRWAEWQTPLKRYLAAKSLGNWTSYQGRGLLTIVRGLEAALALVRVEASRQCRDAARPLDADLLCEAFRQADFSLNHLAVGEDLAAAWSTIE
jgi:Fe-S-cluster containining protein